MKRLKVISVTIHKNDERRKNPEGEDKDAKSLSIKWGLASSNPLVSFNDGDNKLFIPPEREMLLQYDDNSFVLSQKDKDGIKETLISSEYVVTIEKAPSIPHYSVEISGPQMFSFYFYGKGEK